MSNESNFLSHHELKAIRVYSNFHYLNGELTKTTITCLRRAKELIGKQKPFNLVDLQKKCKVRLLNRLGISCLPIT